MGEIKTSRFVAEVLTPEHRRCALLSSGRSGWENR